MALGRLSGLVAEYGRVAVGVHVCSSATFFSAAFAGVHYGMDVNAVTALLPVDLSSLEQSGSLATEAAIGFAIYKAAAPVRWPVTGVVTAAVVKFTGGA